MSQWEMVKLGEVCEILRGGSPRPIDRFTTTEENGLNWIKIGDTKSNSKYITNTKEKIKPEGLKNTRWVEVGDFLLSNSMSFGRPYILKIDGCIHDGWLVLKDKSNKFNKDFLYYMLGSEVMYRKFKMLANGAVVSNLNSEIVRNVTVPLPPLETQQHMAKTLDLATGIIEGYRQKLTELDKLVQSVFYEMFGDPVENEKGWEKHIISDFADVGSCKRVFVDDLVEEGIPFYRGTEIGQLAVGNNIKPTLFITKEKYQELTEVSGVPKVGDLLMPSICSDGRIWCVNTEEPFYFKDGRVLRIFGFQSKVNSIYLLNALKVKFANDYLKIASGTTFAELKIFALKEVAIYLPPLPLQEQFAQIVEKIEEEKVLVQKGLYEAEQLFGGLLQEYFEN